MYSFSCIFFCLGEGEIGSRRSLFIPRRGENPGLATLLCRDLLILCRIFFEGVDYFTIKPIK